MKKAMALGATVMIATLSACGGSGDGPGAAQSEEALHRRHCDSGTPDAAVVGVSVDAGVEATGSADASPNTDASTTTNTTTPDASTTPPSDPRAFGFSTHVLWQSDSESYTALAAGAAATTIRDDISWGDIEATQGQFDWSNPDRLVTYAASHGLHVLMVVDTSPAWASGASTNASNWWWYPPTNPSDYGDFAGRVAARYGANGAFWSANPSIPKVLPAGIEIWNEPNLSGFWPSGSDPVKYTAMLKAAYSAIKAQDPSMLVVSAGLAPHGGYSDVNCDGVADSGRDGDGVNGLNFIEAMYANGAAGSFDAVAYHPYNYWTGATASQMLSYHPCSAWSQLEATTPSVRSLMTANGDAAKGVWATELGAPTCVPGATYPCVDESEQANLVNQEVSLWKGFAWSGNYYWYDLRDDNGGTSTSDMEQHFGAVRADDSLKPAYSALKSSYSAP